MNDELQRPVVSVIMPAYNEEKLIEVCFNKVLEVMKGYGKPFEIILEQDGSTDKTAEIMDKIAGSHSNVKALHFLRRRGKGFGIRKCFEAARGEYIVLIDSDMEYPPEKIPELLDTINGNDIVVGSRKIWINRKNGNTKMIRAYLSRFYSTLVKQLFGVSLEDYQSGFKAFRRRVIDAIQPLTSNGFEIDSEILIKATRKGFKIGFMPVTYTYKGNSKVNIYRDSPKMLLSLIRWKLNGKLEFFNA
ncbi:glycosyltransferase family 2 protein [Candidatus Bathyarchaeota archaeon]|nr:glycosyltransferase family 2 protein [Candidatus Bathyarchaeota archaeon]